MCTVLENFRADPARSAGFQSFLVSLLDFGVCMLAQFNQLFPSGATNA